MGGAGGESCGAMLDLRYGKRGRVLVVGGCPRAVWEVPTPRQLHARRKIHQTIDEGIVYSFKPKYSFKLN